MFTKITKALVAALVLGGVSLSLGSTAFARPSYNQWQGDQNYMDRATNGGAGHHTGDTNGGA
jgi:hypothetical protein